VEERLEELPLALVAVIPEAHRGAVRRWWADLATGDRQQVLELWDERQEECFFGPVADGEVPPVVFGGCFLPHDDAWRFGDWEDDWREYLVEHPARQLGDRWAEGSVLIAAQFPTVCRLDGSGVRCRIAEWGRTRFEGPELPPSERQCGTPASLDRG
jgi:hypothetical protein